MDEQLLVLSTAESQIISVIEGIKEELDDHREAINENTNEIQANYELVAELSKKVDRLSQRLDELYLLVRGNKDNSSKFMIAPLTEKEKEAFQALYVLSEDSSVTYRQLSRRLIVTENLVASYMTNLIEKGVPVIKKYYSGKVFLSLDHEFRQVQTKNNIVGLSTPLTHWVN